MAQRRRSSDDHDDLAGLDFGRLDLSHIELEEDGPSRWRRPLVVLVLLAICGLVLWIPQTAYYRLHGESSWLFFVIGLVGIVTGISLGRILWTWAEELAERYSARRAVATAEPAGPPSPLRRWLTLLAGVGGALAIALLVPGSSYYASGASYDTQWFFGAGGAVVVGIVLGRWLVMQATARETPDEERPPLRLPPWFKWVTLAGLVVAGLVVLFGAALFGSGAGDELETALGGVGFVVGIFAAIWVARRFDEIEQAAAQKKAERAPPKGA